MPLFTEFAHSSRASIDLEHRPQLAGVVAQVIDGSPAELAGIVPGDQILAVNGHRVEDVIDVQFYGAEEDCTITICRSTQEYQIWVPKNVDQQLGIAFEDDLFDGVRICRNRCDFCFVDQQPNGMRDTLKIRDDDFRLSFLHGNFITLTNLTDYDWRRVFQQKLSPLFVSVHATDDALRKRLLRNNRHKPILDEIKRLVDGGISMHTQVVLCQGLNDGSALDRTIEDLSAFHPYVQSLAVVPMGITDYRLERNESDPCGPEGSKAILKQLRPWQQKFEVELGSRFVFASDEMYLLAGKPLPQANTYQGFPQLSNGLGGCRIFLDELNVCRRKLERSRRTGNVQIVTGTLAAPILQSFAEGVKEILGYDTQVVAATNNWYGPCTTVAGLLTGRDVKDALVKAGHADVVIIPRIMLRENTELFLDEMAISDISAILGRPVIAVPSTPMAAIEALAGWGDRRSL